MASLGNAELWPGKIPVLGNDLVLEVLKRVDPATLATASCVSSGFRSISEDEALWEKFCNKRWPSTKESEVQSIVASVGGYRKLYAECCPLILSTGPGFPREDQDLQDRCDEWLEDDDESRREAVDLSPDDFISIVDILYNGEPVFSRTVEAIPGAHDFLGWFSNCPFRLDLLKSSRAEEWEQGSQNAVVIEDNLPSVTSLEKERKHGKFWKALWDNMRVSWILINKKTKSVANLSSWKPLGGIRHWPSDENYLIRFGSILPAFRDCLCRPVQCSIVMKCSFANVGEGESMKTILRLTELSMQLEDIEGTLVNGKDSVAILNRALSCPKSNNHSVVINAYHMYLKAQSELREERTRHEGRLDAAAIVSGISVFFFMCYFML